MGLLNCLLYDKDRHQITNTMKAFIFLCLVAAAMAEADPQFLYGNYGYNTYSGLHYGGAYNPYYTPPYVYGGIHHLGKREAEADPALVYSSGYHYPTVYSGIHNYGYSGLYNHGIYSGLHYGKRSADAEPKADAALIYSGLHYPSTYGYGLHNYGYSGLYNHGIYSG